MADNATLRSDRKHTMAIAWFMLFLAVVAPPMPFLFDEPPVFLRSFTTTQLRVIFPVLGLVLLASAAVMVRAARRGWPALRVDDSRVVFVSAYGKALRLDVGSMRVAAHRSYASRTVVADMKSHHEVLRPLSDVVDWLNANGIAVTVIADGGT